MEVEGVPAVPGRDARLHVSALMRMSDRSCKGSLGL